MTKEIITEKIYRAYNTLLSRDNYLLDVNVNERSITHKLAEYLQVEFPEWNVDCEYNRDGEDVKMVAPWESRREALLSKLKTEISEEKRKIIERILDGGISVYPDIIIHHRGTNNNLVVIEAKKSNYDGDDFDEEKLESYKSDLLYQYAIKINFPVEGKAKNANADVDIKIV